MRERFGVSWFEAGQPHFPWREAWALVQASLEDPSTRLGAAAAGWTYPASFPELYIMRFLAGDDIKKALPFNIDAQGQGVTPSEDEVTEALAELENELLFG